jgi:segregation and condensation protein A
MSEETQAADSLYRVELPVFEGPLDLLLHLVKRHELSILDIPIGFITEKYLAHLELMRALNLDVAADYLLMAATLTHLKSRELLPPDPTAPAEEDEEVGVDPRAELIRRLLEYQKYKDAAERLASRPTLGRDVFARGSAAAEQPGEEPLAEVGLFALLDALARVLERTRAPAAHDVMIDRVSVLERIHRICDLLDLGSPRSFEELLEVDERATRAFVIATFLALLEMARLRMIRIAQAAPHGAIFVSRAEAPPPPPDALQEDYR